MKCGFQTTDGAPDQFVLLRFDTVSFCCVINKCQTRTNDNLEKCVHSVVLLCSIRRRSDKYLAYKRKTKILEKWRFISQHSLLLVRYT